ncbi:MAG: DUF2341 domain-containing protein [Chitinivibrionales bacterium]|nr:DUF2341 domain-containing protein [Chitinivibrionales bacterium]
MGFNQASTAEEKQEHYSVMVSLMHSIDQYRLIADHNPRTALVYGTVLDTDSIPAANATVRLRPVDYLAEAHQSGLVKKSVGIADPATDETGAFFIADVEPGSYTIEATDNKSVAARITCEVVPGEDTLDLGAYALAPFARLSGSVALDSGTGSMHAAIYGLERSVAVDSLTGAWSIDDLPQGAHTVRIASSSRDLGAAIIDAPPVAAGASDTLTAVRLLSYNGESYTQWAYSRTITINTSPTGADISEDVHRFPLLVRLDASNFGFSGARADGRDIRFAKPDGTPLRYEIEQWDPVAQQAAVWVLMDTVYADNATQSITMHWGKADAQDFSNGAVVFDTANGFMGVWHLDGRGGRLIPALAIGVKTVKISHQLQELSARRSFLRIRARA